MGEDELALGWDEYFIGIAEAVSKKSKDPSSQVGAVLVSKDHVVISTGFNGLARGLKDDRETLNDKWKKLNWVVHAEHNAILNAARYGVSTQGCTLYVNKFPCFACMMVVVQAGLVRLYTNDSEYWKNDPLDKTHDGKRYVQRVARLEIAAPNHPEYKLEPPELLRQGPGSGPGLSKTSTQPESEESPPAPAKDKSSAGK
jgi:dCMP deaminase